MFDLPRVLILERNGRYWLPAANAPVGETLADFDIVHADGEYFEVSGFSAARRSYWLTPISIEGAAAELELELDQLQ